MVSIIVPNYNHARFLKRRLDSIINQTYQDFEVIVLDDASTDNSLNLIEQYKDHSKFSQIIVNTENSGITSKQWKKGIELAKGDFIWIAESDDYADESFLANLVPVLEDNPRVGLVYCQSYIVNEVEQMLSNNKQWTDDLSLTKWKKDYINEGKHECANFLIYKNTIPNASAVLLRKEAINIEKKSLEMRMTGDWLNWCAVLRKWDIAFTPKALNYFRQHIKSSRNHNSFWLKSRRLSEGVIVFQFVRRHFDINGQLLKDMKSGYIKKIISLVKHYRRINKNVVFAIIKLI